MIKSNIVIFILFLLHYNIYAQNMHRGKIDVGSFSLGTIYITNTTNGEKTTADANGFFSITMSENHVLSFSGEKINKRLVTIKKENLLKEVLLVAVFPKTNQLQEVEINKNQQLNATSLGIVSKDVKSYTPAERKFRTAGKFKWYSPLLIPFGGMSVDGLINKISGRTAMLKKELIIERQEQNQKKLLNLFSENFFLETLKIPAENLTGFLMIAVEDNIILDEIAQKDTIGIRFRLIELALIFRNTSITE